MAQCWLLRLTEPVTEGLDPKPEAQRLTGRGARRPALNRWLPGALASSFTASTPRTQGLPEPEGNSYGLLTISMTKVLSPEIFILG